MRRYHDLVEDNHTPIDGLDDVRARLAATVAVHLENLASRLWRYRLARRRRVVLALLRGAGELAGAVRPEQLALSRELDRCDAVSL